MLGGGEVGAGGVVALVPDGVEGAEFFEGGGFDGGERGESGFQFATVRGFFASEEGAGEWGLGCSGFLSQGGAGLLERGDLSEKVGEVRGDAGRGGCGGGPLEVEQVSQARGGIAQSGVGGIERDGVFAAASGDVGMLLGGGAMEGVLECRGVEPGTARLGEKGEMVGHADGVGAGRWGAGQGISDLGRWTAGSKPTRGAGMT